MYWDEDNRLMVLSDNGKTCRYTYNAAGERIVKSHGDLEGVYINGAPQGISFHETEDYTIYPAPIITVTKNRFTKHYFIGDKRVASKLGTGRFSNVYGIGGNNITAGQKDYAARMMQIEKQREEYYKQLGTPPGVPTMKGATADPDNTGIGYNSIITDLGDHSVPEGWIQHPKFNGKGDVPGPPIQWNEPESPDNAQPGYGYISADTTNTEEIFFYHSDHLGSTSYITDDKANITQYDAYLPYGELLVDEHSSSEDLPYKFNGKKFDDETGLYYYGARYMDPIISLWYGVDNLTEKYVSVSSYTYCNGSPIANIDVMGMFPKGIVVKHVETVVLYQAVGSANTLMGIPHEVTYYTFTESAAHLLSLVANVSITYVKNARLEEFISQPEDNCITIGGSPNNARILVSPYYLDNSKGGQDYDLWFRQFSHEVGHTKQIARDKGLTKYLLKTIAGYIKAGNHDDALREIEAEQGTKTYNAFRGFVKTHFKASVENLFKNDKLKEKDKIEQINKWWNEFKKQTSNKK
ncbi:RHS repeat domain-containing protein [Segatella hominis]|uniref:RHS repeat domain-containing protein n=1 Tax=Segatella hominis TaxID=2518605 RepID=UPI0035293B29